MEQQTLLECKNISKQFPGVKALDNVSLTLNAGEVLGLVGENGAGKSTLVKMIIGVNQFDEGEIYINGELAHIKSPLDAKMTYNVAYVSQENVLCPDLTVAENMALGNWKLGGSSVNWNRINEYAQKALDALDIKVDPTSILREIAPSDRQMVEIARAIALDSRILLLDEPTSWLSEDEKVYLFDRVKYLTKEKGVGVIFISHFLDEVLANCDRIQVMREGKNVGVFEASSLTKTELIAHMLGKVTERTSNKDSSGRIKDEVVLEVKDMYEPGIVKNISFKLHRGEILGVTGLFGCGKSELARMIYGVDAHQSGQVFIGGEEQTKRNPEICIKKGLGFITKDRKEEGIIPLFSIKNNITLANLKSISKGGVLNFGKEAQYADEQIDALNVKPRDPEKEIMNLSGGNQQKVIVAKWLQADCDVLMFDEPTRGIDIGAKNEIYELLEKQAEDGKGILFISSELAEILDVSDRILIIKNGQITGEYSHGEIKDEHQLLAML